MNTGGVGNRISSDKVQFPGMLDDIRVRLLYSECKHMLAGGWDHGWLPNEYWRLYYNDGCGGILNYKNEEIHLKPNGVYLIPNYLKLSSRLSQDLKHFFIHFDLIGVSVFAFRDLFPGPVLVEAPQDFRRIITEMGDKISRLSIDNIAIQYQLKGIIYSAFGYYMEHLPEELIQVNWSRRKATIDVTPALQLIEKQLEHSLTNKELANACAMSENHFIRQFRQAVGLTPAAFIQQKRMSIAAQLLLYTNESIDSIAIKTGFTDRFYFSRIFRQIMGSPPATYRRSPRP